MERLFPELEKYSTNDTVKIAPEEEDGTEINESALQNGHLLKKQ